MQTEYSSQLDKFRKFNIWELNQYRKKSSAERLQEFADLFELTYHMDSAVREREHHRHLESLVWVQRLIKDRSTTGE